MEDSLMSSEEGLVCIKIASGEPPYSQRAQALLALNSGVSQAEAAAQSGLTENQVRYWLGRFRSRGLAVFPDELVTAVSDEVVTELADAVVEEDTGSGETAVSTDSKKKKVKKKQGKEKETKMTKKKKADKKKKSAKKKSTKKKDNKKKKSSKKDKKEKTKKSKKKAKKK